MEELIDKVNEYFSNDYDINGEFANSIANDAHALFSGKSLDEICAALREASQYKNWFIEHTCEELIFACHRFNDRTLYIAG